MLSPIKFTNCIQFSNNYEGENKISFNLANQYNIWINNVTDSQPGQNLTLDYFKMFYGILGVKEAVAYGESDGIVAKGDILEISGGINANIQKEEPQESYRILGMFHTSDNPSSSLPDNIRTKTDIKKFLNNR